MSAAPTIRMYRNASDTDAPIYNWLGVLTPPSKSASVHATGTTHEAVKVELEKFWATETMKLARENEAKAKPAKAKGKAK